MDELNKRIIEIMVRLDLNKSAFAKALDVSLPLITHITSGRNKPGVDLIQKILLVFEQINPDWLLLGKGEMYRQAPKKQDLTPVYAAIARVENALKAPEQANETMQQYHKLLIDEVLSLREMSEMIVQSSGSLKQAKDELEQLKAQLKDQ